MAEKERNGLTVLVHALTGDNLKDHTEHAYWLGHPVALNLSIFQSN
ncbi:DOPA 4,5-dioxygenase family protein [Psychromonas aquatilis]|uniref:DOPA 4,5-dioxygenase family protein n=1 Tax=Psychromonas aquatilis TaxID=2005072 RepID=A0ABU9GU89_9GAMM